MGYRDDDIIDPERADAALRRALDRLQALDPVPPPPDLVTQTGRRLPAAPPAEAARQLARRRMLQVGARAALFALGALIVLLGVSGLTGGARVALLFGDGAGGVSRTFLMVQLLAKPLWHSLGSGGAVAIIVALAGAVWLWWWALRRTPIYQVENAP
jgi:hypothetical protein